MREHVATAAAIGMILGVLAPEVDFGPPEAEAARIAPACVESECALPKPQSVQTAAACITTNCARPEEETAQSPVKNTGAPQEDGKH